jgi:hypothetical protein
MNAGRQVSQEAFDVSDAVPDITLIRFAWLPPRQNADSVQGQNARIAIHMVISDQLCEVEQSPAELLEDIADHR